MGRIGDRVWLDMDGDGIQGPSETGMEGVTVELWKDGQLIATTTTGKDGSFSFENLQPGDYTVNKHL